MEALKNFKGTADAINHFVNACEYFREENPQINQLLQQTLEKFLESVGPFIPIDTPSDTKRVSSADRDVDIDINTDNGMDVNRDQDLISTSNPNPTCHQRRKVGVKSVNNEETSVETEAETRSVSGNKKCRLNDNGVSVSKNVNNIDIQEPESGSELEQELNLFPDDSPSDVKVFATNLVLQLILSYLNKKDLLTCRLINSRWNTISSHILGKTLKIQFTFNNDCKLFVVRSASRNSTKTEYLNSKSLLNFTNLLKFAQWKFPCSNYSFDCASFCQHVDLQNFFTLHGKEIKTLSICIGDWRSKKSKFAVQSMKSLHSLLVVQAPNIEKLIITAYPAFWIEKNYSCEIFLHDDLRANRIRPVVLKKLQFLHFDCVVPEQFVKNLLDMTSNANLKEVTWDSRVATFGFLRPLVNRSGCQFVKKINLNLSCLNASIHGEFSEECSRLEDLYVDYPEFWVLNQENDYAFKASVNILSKILATSANSLKLLSVPPLGYLNTVLIPIMHKLETFVIKIPDKETFLIDENPNNEVLSEGVQSFFTKNLSVSKKFPALKRFRSTKFHTLASKKYWEKCFAKFWRIGCVDPCPFLVEIDFSECVSPPILWLSKMSFMFPNLKVLKLGNTSNINEAMDIIYGCSFLQSLEIAIDCKSWHNQFPSVDSAFTGFSKETCVLYDHRIQTCVGVKANLFERFRKAKSILDLKALRHLTIVFTYDPDNKNQASEKVMNSAPILSVVSGLLAFHACPLLVVHLVLDEKLEGVESALEPILPYVNSVSRKKLHQ